MEEIPVRDGIRWIRLSPEQLQTIQGIMNKRVPGHQVEHDVIHYPPKKGVADRAGEAHSSLLNALNVQSLDQLKPGERIVVGDLTTRDGHTYVYFAFRGDRARISSLRDTNIVRANSIIKDVGGKELIPQPPRTMTIVQH